uniref:Phospholipase A2 n=1 Tax=Pavo cristatus TaxID=9049 RepID=A0A8C9EJ44_PAVCR
MKYGSWVRPEEVAARRVFAFLHKWMCKLCSSDLPVESLPSAEEYFPFTVTITLSQADCYVSLWLPTAAIEKCRTKTIRNSNDPVWNETFYFRIQSRVKNVLELTVYDEDFATPDDHLLCTLFDTAKLPIDRTVLLYFKPSSTVSSVRSIILGLSIYMSLLICKICACVYLSNCSCHQDLDMRFGFDLCSDERAFLGKRKKYVASALKSVFHLQEDLQDHEVCVCVVGVDLEFPAPLCTLLEERSAKWVTCLLLLLLLIFLSLLSFSRTMANLYRDAYWSQKDLDSHISEAQKQATKCKMGCFSMDRMKYYNKQLCQRKEEGYRTSFIDLWGLMIEYLLNDGKDPHKLSDQREALCDGQNPLPIYVSVCVRDNYSTQDFKEWVEFTPYEVGLLKYGAFIPAENFGSKFFMGRMLKKLPESRICYLQGMWSSIFSVNLLQIWGLSHSSEDFWKRWTQDKIDEVDEDPVLPTRPHELRTRMYTPPGTLSSALRGALTDRFSVAQHHNFLKGYQLHNDYFENKHFCQWKDTVLDSRPNELMQNPDHLGMIDAGFFINTSSPPLLRQQREVDVIIYLSYTTGSHISSLDKACKYYSEQKIPFPKISLSDEDKKNLKECYIFQDSDLPGCPIVIFLPLVNDTFQEYKAPGVKRCCSEMEEGKLDLTSRCSPYCMFAVRYTDENYRRLLNLSEYNILNNSQMIMQALTSQCPKCLV